MNSKRPAVIAQPSRLPLASVDHRRVLSGRGLRFVLVDLLMRHGKATVAEMVEAIDAAGYLLPGRASKVISDGLRWEVRRGRVVRTARGCYAFRRAPRSTARRIRLLARRAATWVAAVRSADRVATANPASRLPPDPPWVNLSWLWVA